MAESMRRFFVASRADVDRERLLAEAFEAGAVGAEELDAPPETRASEPGQFAACIYAPPDVIEAVRSGLEWLAIPGSWIGPVEALPEVDWSEAWKQGLEALPISERLVVRPPFVDFALTPGQSEIVIDPGQAFGTGSHASTALCLEWIDVLLAGPDGGSSFDRVLDVGTGSGVLALAAVALGSARAVGFDLDPVAIVAAREAAVRNRLEAKVDFFIGPIEALGAPASVGMGSESSAPYPLVLANLLKREMLPIAAALARWVAPGGRLVLAGLLEEDLSEVAARFAEEGLHQQGRRSRRDAAGLWVAPILGRD